MKGICSACKEPCEIVIIDSGIGSYEYWGIPGNDVQLEALSICCDTPVYFEDSNEFITVSMIKEEYFNEI